jgi:MFS family permease
LIIALVVPGVAATLIGLACVGLGFSTIVPIVFSAAGRTSGIEPSVALATVTTMGYLGFLVGPPLIGFVAQFAGLSVALGVIVVTSLLSVTLASAVAPRYADAPSRWR